MSLIDRVNQLFQADVHGLLDHLEDPLAVLKQAVREMQSVVIENERRLALLEKREQRLRTLLEESGRAITELNSQIELALSSGNDALCRTLVRRKLEEEHRRREVERLIKQLADGKAELASQLSGRREGLEMMIKKMEAYVPLDSSSVDNDNEVVANFVEPRRPAVTEEDVEVAMLKLKQANSTERKR